MRAIVSITLLHLCSCLNWQPMNPVLQSFHLSGDSDTDSIDQNGTAEGVGGANYIIELSKNKGIAAERRDEKLLYD